MNKANVLFSAAALVFGAALTASAAPTVTLTLVPTDATTGNTLPLVDGTYVATKGEQFWVNIYEEVSNPYDMASTRATAVKNKPLGVETVTANLITAGTTGNITPVNDSTSGQAQQINGDSMLDETPAGNVAFPFVNLNPIGTNGDLDVNGTGYVITSLTVPSTAGGLANDSYGADGAAAAEAGPMEILSHLYTYNTGLDTISTDVVALNVFEDTGGSNMIASNDLSGAVNATISVGAVPEPASLSLLGLGALGLIARRRRA